MTAGPKSWRIDFTAEDPFVLVPAQSTRLSTDVADVPTDKPKIVYLEKLPK